MEAKKTLWVYTKPQFWMGHSYTERLLIAYLNFKFNWALSMSILFGKSVLEGNGHRTVAFILTLPKLAVAVLLLSSDKWRTDKKQIRTWYTFTFLLFLQTNVQESRGVLYSHTYLQPNPPILGRSQGEYPSSFWTQSGKHSVLNTVTQKVTVFISMM